MGYGYKESRLFISKEEILMRVTQEEIFKMVLGYIPREHKYVYSPFRKDRVPDCYFEWYKNSMWFIDWAEPMRKRRHRDCFNMVQDHFRVSFYKALELINEHFKLNLLAGHHDDSDYVVEKRKQIVELKERKKDIHDMPFKARMFNTQGDREFWSPFQISRSDLIEDEVFPIIWYKIFSKRLKQHVVIRPQTRSYLIGNFEKRRKFYTPDKKGKGKWATNCIANDIWGFDELPLKGKRLIISKSYKDWRVLKNQGLENVIAFQNEGVIPKEEVMLDLINRFEEIVIFFDNDRAGMEAAAKVSEYINKIKNIAKPIHLPTNLSKKGISDPSDMIKLAGRPALVGFLEYNKL